MCGTEHKIIELEYGQQQHKSQMELSILELKYSKFVVWCEESSWQTETTLDILNRGNLIQGIDYITHCVVDKTGDKIVTKLFFQRA